MKNPEVILKPVAVVKDKIIKIYLVLEEAIEILSAYNVIKLTVKLSYKEVNIVEKFIYYNKSKINLIFQTQK